MESSHAFSRASEFYPEMFPLCSSSFPRTRAGYIQTPGWHKHTLHPPDVDSVVLVDVPPEHATMLTFLNLNLTGRRASCDTSKVTLALYQGNLTEDNVLWECGRSATVHMTRRLLPSATSVYVQFRCGDSRKAGFRLHFSVHKQPAVITPVADDLWNCSGPDFQAFRLHFPCDLFPQCVGKEDEVHCPYTTDACGPGLATIGDRCYFYNRVVDGSGGSWRDLDFLCGQRGGRLGSLRSRAVHEKLVGYLQSRVAVWGFGKLVIGLHTASPSLPHM